MEKIFTPEFIKEIGFKLVSEENGYGCIVDKIGMTHIYWNEEGVCCTYFREKLEPNISMAIRKDADTRYAFNGYVFNQDDVRNLLKMTW